jgi:uncharacterized protein (TIGR03790 family)
MPAMVLARIILFLLLTAYRPAEAQYATPSHRESIPTAHPERVAVIVNEAHPGSIEVGEYYLRARGIPKQNLVKLHFPAEAHALDFADFARLKQAIDKRLSPSIDLVVFVWTTPYAVGCNSLTGAYTLGADPALCDKRCNPSRRNPYFDSGSGHPYKDFKMRLSMLLPVESVEQAKALIDRGVASNAQGIRAKAFFLRTADKARNSRAGLFPKSAELLDPAVSIRTLSSEGISHENDVIMYLTGAVSVPHLETLHFLPGAIADHLTSAGGMLRGSSQMSSLRWLEAGATGTYGTVSEPCNHWQKFPHPAVLLKHYLNGATIIESYWRSVAWPSQGLFVGEPLATPFRGSANRLLIQNQE